MQKYLMKQKFLSISEEFDVYNDADEVVIKVKGKFFSVGKQFTLTNLLTQQITKIRQKVLSLRPTFYIQCHSGQRIKIVKTFFPLFRSQFVVLDAHRIISIKGNFLGHEYKFFDGQDVVAKVSKQWFSFKDSYGIEIENEVDVDVFLSCIIVIDAIHHGNGHE